MAVPLEIPDWLLTEPSSSPPPPVDDHRVEGLVNGFIAGKQDALFDAPDAYYRQLGRDAVDGAPAIARRLQDLRTATLDLARDDGERTALGPRLDAHLDDAMDGIGRHLDAQQQVMQRQILSERQRLIQRAADLEHDNDDKIAGLAEANASAVRERARLDGVAPGSAAEAGVLNAARSQILRTAIEQRIANAKGAQALALYDRVTDTLTPADRRALEVPIGAARDDAATDAWLARESAADGPPLADRAASDDRLTGLQRLILQAKIGARESAAESHRAATVKGIDDQLAAATKAIATQPSQYRIGTLNALAQAYEDAGEPDKAADTRRLASQESLLRLFAQTNVATQQRRLDDFTGSERAMAEVIASHQADAFAKDPYAAGTALYPNVGLPVPISDLEGRIVQARTINALRNAYVPPFSIEELTEAGREFGKASPEERDAMLRRVSALPEEVRRPLLEALTAQKEGQNQASLTDAPSETQDEREKRLFGVRIPRPEILKPRRPRPFFEPLPVIPEPEPPPPPRPPGAPPPAPGHRIASLR